MLAVAMIAVAFAIPSCARSLYYALHDTTVYALGYSEQKFQSIHAGMSEEDVIRLIGKPLEDNSEPGYVNWYYGPPTLRVATNGAISGEAYTYVLVDATGRINGTGGNYLKASWQDLIGIDVAEMRRRDGDPVAIRPHEKWRYLAYSATTEGGSYFIRRVWLNTAGRVIQVQAGWYQD